MLNFNECEVKLTYFGLKITDTYTYTEVDLSEEEMQELLEYLQDNLTTKKT